MKTLSKLGFASMICLALSVLNPGLATAGEASDPYSTINAQIVDLEEMQMLAMMAGDYKAAKEMDLRMNDLELLMEMMSGSTISNGTLGSGRFSDIAGGDLGSGRFSEISSGDLGSGR